MAAAMSARPLPPLPPSAPRPPPPPPPPAPAAASVPTPASKVAPADPPVALRVEILPARDPTPADDPVDMFTQDEPPPERLIKLRYVSERSAFVRAYDVEQLAIWLERQTGHGGRDPLFATLHFSDGQRREILRRAAQTFCDQHQAGRERADLALYTAMRVYPDDCLVNLLESLPVTHWTEDALWRLLEEAVQRRRTIAILFLYDEGVRQRRFNISTLTTLLLLAFRNGWPTKELMRVILTRLPSRRDHRERNWPWSPALLVVLTTAVQMRRYRDVARLLRRLACFIRPDQLRAFYKAAEPQIKQDVVLAALFQDKEIGFARLMHG